jgi:hypothetical protein
MNRATNTLLLVVGMTIFFAGAALQSSGLMGVGAATFLLAVLMDYRRAQRSKEERRASVAKKIQDLTSQKWQEGKSLTVPSRSAFSLIVAVLIAIGSAYVAYSCAVQAPINWLLATISLVVFLISAVAIPRFFVGLGKDALILNANGLSTPIFGFIPWRHVVGLNLQTYNFRGQITYTLIFRLSLPESEKFDFHWTESVLSLVALGAMRRGVIAVQLRDDRGDGFPETTTATAKYLWTQATGESHDWNPNFSEEYNAAAKRLSQILTAKRSPQPSGSAAISHLDALTPFEARQIIDDTKTMRGEQTKRIKQLNWIVTVAAIGVFISLAWPLVKPYLR